MQRKCSGVPSVVYARPRNTNKDAHSSSQTSRRRRCHARETRSTHGHMAVVLCGSRRPPRRRSLPKDRTGQSGIERLSSSWFGADVNVTLSLGSRFSNNPLRIQTMPLHMHAYKHANLQRSTRQRAIVHKMSRHRPFKTQACCCRHNCCAPSTSQLRAAAVQRGCVCTRFRSYRSLGMPPGLH